MSTIQWTNALGGDWSLYSNWSPGQVPGSADDVQFNVLTQPYTATINFAESAHSVSLTNAGVTVSLNNSLTIGTTVTISAGTFNLNTAGTLVGGTVIGSGMVFNRGTLSGVKYQGTLDLSAASARVHIGNGITLTDSIGSGPGDVQLTGDSSHIYLRGNQTLDDAAISLGGAAANASIDQIGGGTLTLGTNLTITHAGKYAQIYGLGAKIINAGTIDAGLNGGRFTLVGSSFVNQGLIGITNADVFRVLTQTFANAGTIALGSGGELHFTTVVSQTDPNRSIGYISNSGGTIFIERDFDNAGAVLTTGAGGLGAVVLEGTSGYGSIIGGTVTGSGMVFHDGTLSGVTYSDQLDLSASGAKVNVRNGITLTDTIGTGPGSALLTGNGSQMYFYQTETLDNAAVSIGGASSYATVRQSGGGGTLTLGSGLTLDHTGSRALLYVTSYNSIVNAGTIDAGLSGGRFVVYGDGAFTNTGEIDISNGDLFRVTAYGGFTNLGQITLTSGGKLELASVLTTADLGAVSNVGGTIFAQRTLDNTGSVLTTGPTGIGRVVINNGGLILGGTIAGYDMGFLSGGMSGVTFVGPLDLSADTSHTAITNGITLVATGGSGLGSILLTGNGSYVTFTGTQTLDNAAVSIGGATSYAAMQEVAGGALSLGPGLSITQTGQRAEFYIGTGSTITNLGTVDAGISGGYFQIAGNGSFINQGIVGVTNGETLRVLPNVSGAGTFAVNGNAYLWAYYSSFANTQTVDFTGSAGHLVLKQPTAFHGGIVGFQSGDTVDFRGIGLADHTGYSGGIVTLYDNLNAVLAQATLSTPTPAPSFTLGNDSYGGTVLGLASPVPGPVFNSTTAGVYLYYPSIQNPATIASAATITNTTAAHNSDAVYGISPTAWTLFNYGTISAALPGSRGVLIEAGGAVHNGSTGVIGLQITGDRYGVGIFGGAGSVTNYGTIAGTGGAGYGIILAAGGRVDTGEFGASSALVSGFHAIDIRGGVGTVFNDGTIAGTGAYNYGVRLRGGGDLVNGSEGLITGYYAVAIRTGGGTLTNYGTIAGIQGGAYLTGGAVFNGYLGGSGVLLTGSYGIFSYAGINLTNYGTISGTGAGIFGSGVYVGAGSTVSNGGLVQVGLITGYDGVRISGPSAALTNRGTIVSTGAGFGAQGVDFLSGGALANNGTILGLNNYASGINAGGGDDLIVNVGPIGPAVIAGWLNGIDQFSGTGTVLNDGTISSSHGKAIFLEAGGTVSNYSGGLITGYTQGVYVAGGAGLILNSGSISAGSGSGNAIYMSGGGTVNTGGLISGANDVVEVRIDGFVINSGTIAASAGTGIWLPDGGTVLNHGLVTGTDDVIFTGYTAGTVFNDGTISDTGAYGDGVCLDAGGVVTNGLAGIILGVDKGIEANNDSASVTNDGTVAATGAGGSGIALFAGGSVGNTGLISGGLYGVLVGGPLGIPVFSTGNGSTVDGYADPHWQFTNSGGTTGNALVANNPGVDFFTGGPPWYPDSSSSSWIVDNVTGSPSGGNPLSFFTTFDLSGFDPATATLSGSWTVDDQGVLELNGHVIASITTQGQWDALHPFSVAGASGYFLPGINTLSVVLSVNDNFFEGANVRASATATPLSSNAISNSGTIAGYAVGVMLNGFGSVSNLGTIEATGAASNGVRLSLGGSVVNGGIAAPAALISGASAIKVYGGAGNITNYASIVSSAGYAAGIYLAAGGNITNLPGALVQGPAFGALVGHAAGNIVNFGTIAATGAVGTGIWLSAGGSVANADTGGISGYIQGYDAVVTGSNGGVGVGTVVNEGSIAGVNVGVWLSAGGTAVNYASISATTGDGIVIGSYGGVGGVLNYGTVIGLAKGVVLDAGGSVGNYGTIASGNGVGVDIDGGAGTVVNYGTIAGAGEGVWLEEGGTVVNFATIANTGGYGRGVRISSYGGAGYIRNLDLISGPTAGVLASAPTTVVNYGTISGTGAYSDGVDLIGYPGAVVNFGSISGTIRGVYLGAGGSVTNQVGDVIAGGSGVGIASGAGTVANFGTIAGSAAVGVFLGLGGSVTNGSGVATAALIAGVTKGIIVYGAAAGVVNYGTIAASVSYVPAIYLVAGGTVDNKQSGLIQGGGLGVLIGGGGTVTNSGTIAGIYGAGARLDGGGIVINGPAGAALITGASYGVVLINVGGTIVNGPGGSTGAIISGGSYGVFARDGASTVGNYGTISGAAGGVFLNGGGFVVNAYDALIDSSDTGVRIANAAGALSNAGTVQGAHLGVYLTAGGSVVNALAGTIAGGGGIRVLGAGTVINYGSVSGTAAYTGVGVDMRGGLLVNGAATATGAAIVGARGVQVYNAAGTVTNFGTIAGSYISASAIDLDAGGVVNNRLSGLIQGAGDGISIGGAGVGAGTVTNLGTIVGVGDAGIVLAGGGTIVNGPGGATGALIAGGVEGILTGYLPATIVNYGTIADAGYTGILALDGASIFNNRLITGYQYGAAVKGAAGTVVNSGTMIATGGGGTGVNLQAGGAVDNSGTIAGGRNGIFFGAATAITNHGLINGSGLDGVYAGAGVGVVNNDGTIAALGAGGTGVRLVGGSTLFNAGTIAGGGLSVYFIGGNNRLAIDPNAVFVGNVDASLGAGDILELAGASGSLAGFGSSFIGFEQIAVDPGAIWQLTGPVTLGGGFIVTDAGALDFGGALNNDGSLEIEASAVLSFTGTVGGSGSIDFNGANGTLVIGVPSGMTNAISGFAPTDRIGLVGIGLAASYTYSGGILRLLNGGGAQIAQLTLSTPVTNPHFTLGTDGISGTVLGISAPTGTFTGSYFRGILLNDPFVQNPATITSTAFVTNNDAARYNGDAVYGTNAASWYLLNQGLVTTNPTLTNAVGVRFKAGGTIANSATIIGSINGIVIDGAAGTVANGGIIMASDAATGAGIALHAGGSVSNAAGATISGFNNGVFVSGGAGALSNAGTIHSSTAGGGPGVYFTQGGQVSNLATGLITAYRTAVTIKGAAGFVVNYGTIQGVGTASDGVYLGLGGSVTNGRTDITTALIQSGGNGVDVRNASGTVGNFGTIAALGTHTAIYFGNAGGSVINGASNSNAALISGNLASAIHFHTVAGTVANYGTVQQTGNGAGGQGIYLGGGGLVTNGLGGLILSYHSGISASFGQYAPPAATTVVNSGTIVSNGATSGAGVSIGGGGTIVNNAGGVIAAYRNGISATGAAAAIVNAGLIEHFGAGTVGSAIYLGAGGVVTNYGLISGARSGTSTSNGYPGAVQAHNQRAAVYNFGTIANPNNSNGVNLGSGGLLINGGGGFGTALISVPHTGVYMGGTLGVPTAGAAGTVVNYGTIQNSTSLSPAVSLASGGTAINFGLVSSARTGIAFGNPGGVAGTIDNFGTIVSTAPLAGTRGSGAYLGYGGILTNRAGGLITAERAAVSLAGAGVTAAGAIVTNYGVLSGSTGVSIGAGDIGDNTIVNFGTIAGTSGIAIVLGGGDDRIVIESSSYLNGAVGNFQIGDSFDLPFLAFSATETIARDPGNVLQIRQNGILVYTIQLDPAQDFTSYGFRVANDGFGGTLVLEGPDATPPVTLTRVLAVNANSSATPIGIPAPTDPDDLSGVLTASVIGLPSDGAVVLADGVTPVTLGQGLTVSQLTGLQFIPTAGLIGQTSTFTYQVSDPAGNVSNPGTAFLGINLAPPPNSPLLVNGLGGPEGFGENALAPNDDGSSSAIDITSVFGGGLDFFGHNFSSLYVNNNGNITFSAPLSTFTPGQITAGFNNPIIAAFWADVDTRGGPGVPTGGNATGSNTVYWDLDPVNHTFTVTWDDVGYFSGHNDKLDAFQLQLIDEGGGDFDIIFRYQAIYWTTGDASGGSGGFGGSVARAGFNNGDALNGYELPQSGNQSAMLGLDSEAAPAGTQGVTNQIGVYRFEVRDSVVHPPAPTNLALASDADNIAPNNNHTTDPTPTVTGQGITGDTVTVLADGNAVGSTVVQSNGAWSVTLSALAVGAHSLTATQANPAGDVSQPSTALAVTIDAQPPEPPQPQPLTTQFYDFLFTYNDGKDYYFGSVFDSGNFGYQVGQTITFGAGHYQIVGVETSAIAQATGVVSVSLYSHGGIGQAAPIPVKTGQGLADGAGGLGSETDSILGIDGDLHAFSGAVEASFQTTDLWGFIYTYADGRAFYTGTVASASALNGFNVTDGSGNLVGTYSVFKQGQTTRANNTVVVDRFTLNGLAFLPVRSGVSLVNGQGGLGTEQGQISVNGALLAFSDRVEPTAIVSQPTLPLTPPPSAGDVIAAEVNALYREVLGRNPDPSGFATFTAQLAGGASILSVRTTLAQSSEAQNNLNQLYHQIFGRNIDASGAVAYTNALINGSSLATIQLLLAQSPEAQSAIQLIYQQVLGRAADGGGLTAYMAAIGNPTAPMSLADVRSTVAHSPEAAADLSQLVLDTLHRPTFAAELVGMENEIATDGKTQQTLQSELITRNTAGTYTVVSDPNGSSLLGAQAGVPTLFLFSDVSLASDTIVGFDPTRDTIQLPTSIAADFQAVQSHMTTSQFGGTLIHFSSSQEIAIDKVAPASLGGTNFRFG